MSGVDPAFVAVAVLAVIGFVLAGALAVRVADQNVEADIQRGTILHLRDRLDRALTEQGQRVTVTDPVVGFLERRAPLASVDRVGQKRDPVDDAPTLANPWSIVDAMGQPWPPGRGPAPRWHPDYDPTVPDPDHRHPTDGNLT